MITKRTRRKVKKVLTTLHGIARSVFTKRFAAALLCFAVCLGVMPAEAFALDWKTLVSKKSEDNYGSSPNYNYTTNYYVLEVASGTRLGGGYADNVLYFAVHYTDVEGVQRNAIIMPGVDGVARGFETAREYRSPDDRISQVSKLFGYELSDDIYNQKALGSVSSDRLLFESPKKIQTIDQIQIFGKNTPTNSVWPCQGMRVYEVDSLYGFDMYGWYSGRGFIDLSGTVIAEAVMAPGGGNFTWNTTGGTFSINPMKEGVPQDITLVRTVDKEQYESKYNRTTHVGVQVASARYSPVTIRMDFADQGGAGLESQMLDYSAGSNVLLGKAGFTEAAALTVRYEDVFGDQQDVNLPLIINSLGAAAEVLGQDISLAGFAQQGDSLAIPAMLPNFARVVSTRLTIGEAEAREITGITVGSATADDPVYKARAAATEEDDIRYACLAYYTDADVGVSIDGGVLRYSFDAGEKNPVSFSAATSVDGLAVSATKTTNITTNDYYDKMVLKPEDHAERYLVTISTDNISNAGTTSDIQIQFSYKDIKEKENKSPMYHIKDYINAFYGEWPGNVGDFSYRWTMRDGGTAQFMITLSDVREFTGVAFKLEGNDEWQFSGLRIDSVKRFDTRSVEWKELASSETILSGEPRYRSHVKISRRVDLKNSPDKPLFQVGSVYMEDEDRPEGGSSDWKPGTLVQDDDNTTEFNGTGEVIDKQDEIDWSSILHYMSYEQATQDLKFAKQRTNYKVSVHVGGDKVNADDEDCGSKNLFYFQLIFENGKSGCLLANQQIQGDAFRTGSITEFYIPCAQDYGNLTAIQIIPDDQDGNSDIYDKLKISSIDVEKMTDDFIAPTWSAASADGDGLGWVGIEYREQGEMGSNKGSEGRSVSEIATTYQITESSYNAKFLISLKTGPYKVVPRLDEGGHTVYIQDPIYSGGMTMTYSYFDTNGQVKNMNVPIDIVALMNEYSARKGSNQRKTELVDENYEVEYNVSDPQYNFRAGKTDSFYITIKNISQFINMSLQLKSDVRTHWNVTSVMIYLVNGMGIRYLNGYGEYDYKYPDGKDPTLVAEWTRDEGVTADLGIYRYKQGTGMQEISNILLDCSPIEINPDAAGWKSVISREPKSSNDLFNLYIYPQTSGERVADPDSYTLKAAVRYKNALTLTQVQTSAGLLRKAYGEDGKVECFYSLGLDAKNMGSFENVAVDTNSVVSISAPLTRGVLQVVRGGVLMESYDLTGVPNADLSGAMTVSPDLHASHNQKILIQMSDNVEKQDIEPEVKDLAVALHFVSDLPGATELRSKYVYLSDLGYKTVSGGQLYEIDMDLGDLASITGINVVALGALDVEISAASAAEMDFEGNVYNTFSYYGSFKPTGRASRIEAGGAAMPMTLTVKTAYDESTVSSGTKGPVRMTVGYYDAYGAVQEQTYENIRNYISSGPGFKAGETDVIKILVPGMTELRWLEFEPMSAANTSSTSIASWKLESLTAETGFDGYTVSRNINQLVLEGEPLHLSLADIMLTGKASITVGTGEDAETSTYSVSSGDGIKCMLDSGNHITVETRVFGSHEGVNGIVESYDPTSGAVARVRLNSKHGYTEEYLDDIYKQASASASSGYTAEEQDAAERVLAIVSSMINGNGDFKLVNGDFVFTAPRNFTGRDLYYRITISSAELTDVYYTIDVTVYSEADTLSDAISIWKTAQYNAGLQENADMQTAGSGNGADNSGGE